MIGQLRGIILEKQPPLLLLDVQGVGYEIDAPLSTFDHLPSVGTETIIYTHLVVREDAHLLYGFASKEERTLFRTLLKVNGVGPRLALTVLSAMAPQAFVDAVLNNNTASLVAIPGIGKKTAERLVIEIRDKLDDWQPVTIQLAPLGGKSQRHPALQDAISALVSLGYKQQEANRVVAKIDDGAADAQTLIRLALREMM
jgi:Holliday junction DNA helicase RuvA